MSVRTWSLWALCLLAVACSAKRLPPGTPPPEYEQRPVVPWEEGPPPAAALAPAEPAAAAETPDAGASEAPDAAAPAPDAGPGVFPERSGE